MSNLCGSRTMNQKLIRAMSIIGLFLLLFGGLQNTTLLNKILLILLGILLLGMGGYLWYKDESTKAGQTPLRAIDFIKTGGKDGTTVKSGTDRSEDREDNKPVQG